MKIFAILMTVAGFVITCCFSAYRPEWLGNNKFLHEFIGSPVVEILVVVLSITFASAENIHLHISKLEGELGVSFKTTRDEINQNLWGLFFALACSIVLLIWKGKYEDNDTVLSFVHGFHLVILLIYLFVIVDIYGLIEAMAPVLAKRKGEDDEPQRRA